MSQSRTLVLATKNPDKVAELRLLFADLPLARLVCAADIPGCPDVVEDGKTLEENALKKAREIAFFTDEMCVADDTGLEVDMLDGEPGVFSARYAGDDATYEDNWRKLVRRLDGVALELRGARFRTVMALVDPKGSGGPVERTVDGTLDGQILEEPRGSGGFGYDPVFYLPELRCTLAELSMEQKNRVSHRALAAQKMHDLLGRYLG